MRRFPDVFTPDRRPDPQRHIKQEGRTLQQMRYRSRPLAFLTAAQRAEVGHKISAGLRRYHARWRV
jgi:hypothetical protein